MRVRHWPSVVITWALLFAGLTNAHAHVHLCFDGQEEPAAVHVADHGNHLQEHLPTDDDHDDIDVDVPNQAIAKALKHDLYGLAPYAVGAIAYDGATAIVAAAPATPPPRQPPAYLLPPLRAPPR